MVSTAKRLGTAWWCGWGGLAVVGALGGISGGIGGLLIMLAWYALVVAVVALVRGHVSWALMRTRVVAVVVLVTAVGMLGAGGALVDTSATEPAAGTASANAPRASSSAATPHPVSSNSPAPPSTDTAPAPATSTASRTSKFPTSSASASGSPSADRDQHKVGSAVTYAVMRVVDGDTVHVSYHGDSSIRVIGINTPETVAPGQPVQCGGPEASRKAHELLDGKQVRLVFDPSQGRHDKYGRTLAYLTVPGIGDYGAYMIKHGYAFEYTYASAYRRQATYRAAQQYARTRGLGVWGECGGQLKPEQPKPRATHSTAPPTHKQAPPKPAPQNCLGYSPCLPTPPTGDWNCPELRSKGLTPVRVTGSDPYHLDSDGDGWGCE